MNVMLLNDLLVEDIAFFFKFDNNNIHIRNKDDQK